MDLTAATTSCFPFEALTTVKVLALNPAGTLMLTFDAARGARSRSRRARKPPVAHPALLFASRTAARCW